MYQQEYLDIVRLYNIVYRHFFQVKMDSRGGGDGTLAKMASY